MTQTPSTKPIRNSAFLLLSLICAAVAAAIVLIGKPTFGPLQVGYVAPTGKPAQAAKLPFIETPSENPTTFTVDVPFTFSTLSAKTLRVAADECVDEFTVNDAKPHDLRKDGESSRCWPATFSLKAPGEMREGENRLRITVTNKEGPYGIDIAGSLTTPAALTACVLVWAALFLCLYPQRRQLQSLRIKPLSSRHVRRFWPVSYGVIAVAGLRLNTYSAVSPQDVPLVMLASCTVAMALLLAVLDRQRTQPLPQRWSPGWALASMIFFSLAAYKHIEYTDTMIVFGPILFGVVAATFATTPFFATHHRLRKAPLATIIAFFAAAMPFVYEQCQLLLWRLLVNPTTEAVAALAKFNGWNASTSYGNRFWDDGTVRDYHGYVTTPEFSIQIGSWCGGFEGMTLFLFLLSAFVLLDWEQFARRRRLWLPFLATLPYLFVVNVLRITGVLLYALGIVVTEGNDAASNAAIGTFHSHIGWVLYSLAFGPYLWAVYKSAENRR